MKMPLKQLALREWTIEWAQPEEKKNAVLLVKRNNEPRGSVMYYPIIGMRLWNGDVIIKVENAIPSASEDRYDEYSTKNVEEWPSLDVTVFRHFGVVSSGIPDDIEYVSWMKDLVAMTPDLMTYPAIKGGREEEPITVLGLERPRPVVAQPLSIPSPVVKTIKEWVEPPPLKLFTKWIEGTTDELETWVNDRNLVEQIISISYDPQRRFFVIFYRATERVK